MRPELDRLKELAGDAASQTREAIYALRAPEMVHEGVVGGIRSLLRGLKADGIEGSLSVSGVPGPLPAAVEDALFKLAQEAVSNARKHSEGSAVMVTLRFATEAVTLVVQDNGVGLPPGAEGGIPGHFGLPGMQERVAALGGTLRLLAGDEGGLIVRATIPIERSEAI
jgi:signal transduction histidine kinase